jgi:hypothetical protein
MVAAMKQWGANINTWIGILGFLITLGTFYGAYTAFKAETALQLREVKDQRAADVARMEAKTSTLETAVHALALQDARQIEQNNSMQNTLQRIERSIDKLAEELP